MECTWVLKQPSGIGWFLVCAGAESVRNRFAAIISRSYQQIDMEVNGLDIDLTLQLTAQSPLPKAMTGDSTELLSCTPDTPIRKKWRHDQTSKQVNILYVYIHTYILSYCSLLALTVFISIDSSLRL